MSILVARDRPLKRTTARWAGVRLSDFTRSEFCAVVSSAMAERSGLMMTFLNPFYARATDSDGSAGGCHRRLRYRAARWLGSGVRRPPRGIRIRERVAIEDVERLIFANLADRSCRGLSLRLRARAWPRLRARPCVLNSPDCRSWERSTVGSTSNAVTQACWTRPTRHESPGTLPSVVRPGDGRASHPDATRVDESFRTRLGGLRRDDRGSVLRQAGRGFGLVPQMDGGATTRMAVPRVPRARRLLARYTLGSAKVSCG